MPRAWHVGEGHVLTGFGGPFFSFSSQGMTWTFSREPGLGDVTQYTEGFRSACTRPQVLALEGPQSLVAPYS